LLSSNMILQENHQMLHFPLISSYFARIINLLPRLSYTCGILSLYFQILIFYNDVAIFLWIQSILCIVIEELGFWFCKLASLKEARLRDLQQRLGVPFDGSQAEHQVSLLLFVMCIMGIIIFRIIHGTSVSLFYLLLAPLILNLFSV
jgi:hypothetical protein